MEKPESIDLPMATSRQRDGCWIQSAWRLRGKNEM